MIAYLGAMLLERLNVEIITIAFAGTQLGGESAQATPRINSQTGSADNGLYQDVVRLLWSLPKLVLLV